MLVAGLGAGVALADESEAIQQIQNATTPQESESPQPTEDTGDIVDETGANRDEQPDSSQDVESTETEPDNGDLEEADQHAESDADAIDGDRGRNAMDSVQSVEKQSVAVPAPLAETNALESDAGIETLDLSDYTVAGVTPRGTTIDLFDYWTDGRDERDDNNPSNYQNLGINAGHMLKFGKGMGQNTDTRPANLNSTTVNAWTMSAAPRSGIVASRLGGDGYPVLSGTGEIGTESLAYLFDRSSGEGKQAFTDVGDLLQVDADGYYYYDSMKNFAQFNEGPNDFTLYNTWGVWKSGNSPDGQFFPFNTGSQVFNEDADVLQQKTDVTSKNAIINHYFGVHMDTRFIQQDGGYTGSVGNRQEVTYNFSGDDDVWVFIDDVLVGDLGGIHDRTSLEINFHDGHVYVYDDKDDNNQWSDGDHLYHGTTIAQLMRDAHGTADGLSGDTFEDGTYHTLDFFYLERGNSDSNMSLKYNLVVPPETDIVKIDQDGERVADAGFAVYVANADYKIQNDDEPVCTATTDANGEVVLLDDNDNPITFDRLWDLYGDRDNDLTQSVPAADGGGRRVNLVLRETTIPQGYRSPGDMRMYLWHKDGGEVQGDEAVNLLLADMSTNQTKGTTWQTGVYSQPTVLATAPKQLTFDDGTSPVTTQTMDGRLFAIVEKRVGNGWVPVYGSHTDGWKVAPDGGWASIRAADKATDATFLLASSGSHQTLIDGLPGRIQDYVFFKQDDEYRGAYYYTTASNDAMMDSSNTHRVSNTNNFGRQFAAYLYVPDIKNRVIVQKTDEKDNPVNGAEFTMYADDNDHPDLSKPIGEPVETRTLKREQDKINLDGAAVFSGMTKGTYWIKETKAPAGYAINTIPAKVIVTADGVYADAGKADDGVKVTRGVGRIVRSMLQFATANDIDATLNQIVAIPQTGRIIKTLETGETVVGDWNDSQTVSGATKLHLQYDGDNAALDYNVVNPPTSDADRRFTVDTGIPYLKIQQCNNKTVANKDNIHVTKPRIFELGDTDISGLFTGVTIVQVTDQRVGSLKISKTVTGENAPQGAPFTFDIALTDGATPVSGKFTAGVYDANTNNRVDGSFEELRFDDKGMAAIKLESGQYAVIEGLPVGTSYTVTERNPGIGYEPSCTVNGTPCTGATASGSIEGQDTNPGEIGSQVSSQVWAPNQTVDYTNEYTPSVEASFTIAKDLHGRDWQDDDSFSFLVSLQSGDDSAVTMPIDSDGNTLGTTAHPIKINSGTNGHAVVYDGITFTQKGTYVFEVTEVKGGAENMYYSAARFTVTVTVDGFTAKPTVAVDLTEGDTAEGAFDDGTDTVTFVNTYVKPVSSLPLTGGNTTARALVLIGGGVLLTAAGAWLLARRRMI